MTMKKIKQWFKKLFLKWGNGVDKNLYEDALNVNAQAKICINKQNENLIECEAKLKAAKESVEWLRADNEKFIAENKELKRQIEEINKFNLETITAEVDLTTSKAWNIEDTSKAVQKLKNVFIKQFGEACLPYMKVFRDDKDYLTACINIAKYDN